MNLRLIREESEPPVRQEDAMGWIVRLWIFISTVAAIAVAVGFYLARFSA